MNTVELRLSEPAKQVLRDIARFPASMMQAIVGAMDEQNQYTVGTIQRSFLSRRGKRTLGVVTNRLRGSVRASEASMNGGRVESVIGSNVSYAAVHEFGFNGPVTVKAHTRKTGVMLRVRGQLISRDQAKRILKGTGSDVLQLMGVSVQSGGWQKVRQHTRQMRMPERAPFRRGIEREADNYANSISEAILSAWEAPS
jgi:phage gpG-like protein